jgi:hypothetical protein
MRNFILLDRVDSPGLYDEFASLFWVRAQQRFVWARSENSFSEAAVHLKPGSCSATRNTYGGVNHYGFQYVFYTFMYRSWPSFENSHRRILTPCIIRKYSWDLSEDTALAISSNMCEKSLKTLLLWLWFRYFVFGVDWLGMRVINFKLSNPRITQYVLHSAVHVGMTEYTKQFTPIS